MVKDKLMPTPKERNLFWVALICAIPLSIISGLFAGAFFKLIDILQWNLWTVFLMFISSGALLVLIGYLIIKQIKPVDIK